MKLKLIEPKKKHTTILEKNIIGDILYGDKYMVGRFSHRKNKNELIKNKDIFYLDFSGHYNTWNLFEDNISLEFMYECPFVEGNRYYWFVPNVILTDDIKKYDEYITHHLKNIAYDMEWIKQKYNYNARGEIHDSLLGHGYTDGTLPIDGHGYIDLLDAELDNGDMVIGHGWIWYNK